MPIIGRKLWIEQLYIQKNWKTCSLQQVRVILVEGILKWPFQLLTSNGHCIFHRAWKNYCKAILERYWSVQYCTEGHFEKFLVLKNNMAIWSKMKKFWFFWISCFFFFWPYFPKYQHYRLGAVLLRPYWSPSFIWHQFQRNWTQTIFFFQKVSPYP